MNVSFILTLIVEATLSLVQQVFIDSVNFIVQTCNFKNKQICHYSLMKETVKLHQLSTSLQVNLEVCLKEFWNCALLNRAPNSTKLHLPPPSFTQFRPPPLSSFQPPPSSLQHPQQYLNQNIARNWAISPNLGRKIQSCPFWLKIDSQVMLEVLILNPDPQNSFLGKFGLKKWKFSVLSENWHTWYLKDADSYSNISFLKFQP